MGSKFLVYDQAKECYMPAEADASRNSLLAWPTYGQCQADPTAYAEWAPRGCRLTPKADIGFQWRTTPHSVFVYCPTQKLRVDYDDAVNCPDHVLRFDRDQRIVIGSFTVPRVQYESLIGKLFVLDPELLRYNQMNHSASNFDSEMRRLGETVRKEQMDWL